MANFPSTVKPDYPYPVAPYYRTAVSKMRGGNEKRTELPGGGYRRWTLSFTLTATQFATLLAFFIARKGKCESFNFTCLYDSQTYVVRFDHDEFPGSWSRNNIYTVPNLKLVEVDA